jgi:uncharacterized protein YxjI
MGLLDCNNLAIKEEYSWVKVSKVFHVSDAETGEPLLKAHEPRLGWVVATCRFLDNLKRNTPFDLDIEDQDGEVAVSVKRGWTWFFSHVTVEDGNGVLLGTYRQKFTLLKPQFDLIGASGEKLCTMTGSFVGRKYEFKSESGDVLARIDQQWAGLAKEMFTTADNYLLKIDPQIPAGHPVRKLMLGAVVCIDLVMKE